MRLELKRIFKSENYTIGKLYINEKYFSDTLEDAERLVKIVNETCIPSGTYTVIINQSNRFKCLMPLLLNVPNFDGIRIHPGNTIENTSGCILVGKNTIKGQLTESRITFNRLFAILQQAKDKIEIVIN